jgi:hypothetical protein
LQDADIRAPQSSGPERLRDFLGCTARNRPAVNANPIEAFSDHCIEDFFQRV